MTFDDQVWVLASILRGAQTFDDSFPPDFWAREILATDAMEQAEIRLGIAAITPLNEVLH